MDWNGWSWVEVVESMLRMLRRVCYANPFQAAMSASGNRRCGEVGWVGLEGVEG